ncbi:MAG: DUF4239 domain-containing protein [Pseudohongiella sp.]|nr:DUF4239 domain-containing protein [Pseudohongiella sp.]MDO9520036.1 DUF4239 domain-containing protein [Pseudohongiella sp.]MDP2127941.1 DUF4239 domain-containing protein [Pseudohongiella sp.]
MLWIYSLPLWLLAAGTLAVTLTLGLWGVALVRYKGWMLNPEDTATATFTHAFIGVLYAVALGLMVVGVQGGYAHVETLVMTEANLAGDLYRDLEGFNDPARTELQSLTRQYIDSVVEVEWDLVSSGQRSEETWYIIDELLRKIVTYQPSTAVELVVFAEVLDGVNDMLDQRRERLHLGNIGVGSVTWSVVLMGAFITIGMAWFYNTPSAKAHYWLVAMMSSMFGLMIFLIIAMDYPLRGDYSVQPDVFREVQENLDRWDMGL